MRISKNISDLSVCSRSAMFPMIRENSNFSSPSFQISRNLHSRGIHNTRVRINEFIVASWKLVALNENTEGAPTFNDFSRSPTVRIWQYNFTLWKTKQNIQKPTIASPADHCILFLFFFFFIYFSYHCTCNINCLIFVLNHIAHKLQQADLQKKKKLLLRRCVDPDKYKKEIDTMS